jgi:hypothetical protein
VSAFSIAWDGIALRYCLQATAPSDRSSGAIVSLAIAPIAAPTSTQQCGGEPNPIAPALESLPSDYARTVTDPAILHLLDLLQTEIQTPQPASQLVIASIVTVVTTHLLQDWQAEQNQHQTQSRNCLGVMPTVFRNWAVKWL